MRSTPLQFGFWAAAIGIGRYECQRAGLDPSFRAAIRHGSDAKFHPAGHCFPIPWRIGAAVIFFPDSHPRKIGTFPYIGERQMENRRICGEERVLASRIHQVRGNNLPLEQNLANRK